MLEEAPCFGSFPALFRFVFLCLSLALDFVASSVPRFVVVFVCHLPPHPAFVVRCHRHRSVRAAANTCAAATNASHLWWSLSEGSLNFRTAFVTAAVDVSPPRRPSTTLLLLGGRKAMLRHVQRRASRVSRTSTSRCCLSVLVFRRYPRG